jgi:hypothetical protein
MFLQADLSAGEGALPKVLLPTSPIDYSPLAVLGWGDVLA